MTKGPTHATRQVSGCPNLCPSRTANGPNQRTDPIGNTHKFGAIRIIHGTLT